MTRKCALLVLLPLWTLWAHAAGAAPKVLCFSAENQVRIETSVNGICHLETSEINPETAVAGERTCGDCSDLALVLDVVKCRIDTPPLAETHTELQTEPPGSLAATSSPDSDFFWSHYFLRQRGSVHHPLLSRPGSLPLIC